jgi:Immunoglobulin-like domain of bacterial spore germination/Sporulation and spore germination
MVAGRRRSGPLVLALLAALGMTTLTACGDEPGTTTADGTTAASTSDTAASSPSESATDAPTGPTTTVGVYYLVDTRAGLRLAREQREVTGDDPAAGAVAAMVAGPKDPDYITSWNPDTEVLGIDWSGRNVTVDLSGEARSADVGSAEAKLMVQQLVYTVDEATNPKARVRLLIDGRPAGELWGVVDWTGPVRPANPLTVRQLVQIDTPSEGDTVSSPVTVTGVAAALEANVPWRVLDADGAVVEQGFATASEAFTFSPFSFTVELDPGTYTIEVSEDDSSAGEGGEPTLDTRTITVG